MKKYNLIIVVFLCVSINTLKATNIIFNDPQFEAAMLANPAINFDADPLHIDDLGEAAAYTGVINVSGLTAPISSVNFSLDIAHFTNITGLDCSYNQIPSLDLTSNTQLKTVDCSNKKFYWFKFNQ